MSGSHEDLPVGDFADDIRRALKGEGEKTRKNEASQIDKKNNFNGNGSQDCITAKLHLSVAALSFFRAEGFCAAIKMKYWVDWLWSMDQVKRIAIAE